MDNLPVPSPLLTPRFESKDVIMEFYLREANACHDVLDAFGVTRVCDEQTLSVSQRMKALHDMMIKFNVSVVSFREYAESWNASRRGGG